MKSTKRHLSLETGEYLITPEHPSGKYYEVFLDGKKVNDIVGILRRTIK